MTTAGSITNRMPIVRANDGKSWDRIVDQDDVASYTLSIIEDPKENNLVFLGNNMALYVSIHEQKNLERQNTPMDFQQYP